MPKAIGVGCVFWKFHNPPAMAALYAAHLGISATEDGSLTFQGPESCGMCVLGFSRSVPLTSERESRNQW